MIVNKIKNYQSIPLISKLVKVGGHDLITGVAASSLKNIFLHCIINNQPRGDYKQTQALKCVKLGKCLVEE